ncbi:chromate efflux transporter [uncultured Propionivibrio sp.]|uniref:chromate efflux transporter n=1 Tax=uncultured Propionivibrio sp. TaxID=426737 RepID=UPI0029C025A4|nr:chromate efflux transporter [uncultured Propionivibrio sp.]
MAPPSALETAPEPPPGRGSALEVLVAFARLGLVSFGGPVAHLGYFRAEFVERRRWLDDKSYSDLVALCQFLPGPASSQVGIALGLGRAGWSGALAAWLGFTLPSAIALVLFAFGVADGGGLPVESGVIQGLKVAAVAVVAQAVRGMSASFCPDRLRGGVAVVAALLVLAFHGVWSQIAAVGLGGLVGWQFLALDRLPVVQHRDYGVSRRAGVMLLGVFFALLAMLPAVATMTASLSAAAVSAFYRAGALVFGGGHVVLPLLQASVVPTGWVGNDIFLAGYGAAQAVPGPLFSFAAFLGAVMPAPLGGWSGALLMLAALFLPAFLLVAGALPYWESLRQRVSVQRAMGGVNAAVVGILGAALYDPIWTSAIHGKSDAVLALAAYGLLVFGRVSPFVVVVVAATGGYALSAMPF